MVFHGQLAVGLFQIPLADLAVHPEDIIEILLRHLIHPSHLWNTEEHTAKRGLILATALVDWESSLTRPQP